MSLSPYSADLFRRTMDKTLIQGPPMPTKDSIESYLLENHILPVCPGCGAADYKRDGKRGNRQRFRCLHCGRSFGYTSGTPFYRSKQPYSLWAVFCRGIETRTPLREISQQTGISTHTLCKWRQRYLDYHLKMFAEIFEELKAQGRINEEADLKTVLGLMKEDLFKRYRVKSFRLAKERFLKFQIKLLKKLGVDLPLV